MLKEGNMTETWVTGTLTNSYWNIIGDNGMKHYFRSIEENDGRILHVVVDQHTSPIKIITAFFDRSARR
jgi:hypothetical protein